MWCAETSPINLPQPTDNRSGQRDVSDPSINIRSQVTHIRSSAGADTAPRSPTPPGRLSSACWFPGTTRARRRAHRSAGANTPTPSCMRTSCAWRHLPIRRRGVLVSCSQTLPSLVPQPNLDTSAYRGPRQGPHAVGPARDGHGLSILPASGRYPHQCEGLAGRRAAAASTGPTRPMASNVTFSSTAGVLDAAFLTAADVQDRTAFPALLRTAKRIAPPSATCGRTTATPAEPSPPPQTRRVTVDVGSGPKPGRGFIVQPRRKIVERTNALDQPLPPHRPTPHNVPVTSPTRRAAFPTAVAVFGTVRNVKWAVVIALAALAVAGCGSSDSTVSKTPGPSVTTPAPAAAPAVIPSGPVAAPTARPTRAT